MYCSRRTIPTKPKQPILNNIIIGAVHFDTLYTLRNLIRIVQHVKTISHRISGNSMRELHDITSPTDRM